MNNAVKSATNNNNNTKLTEIRLLYDAGVRMFVGVSPNSRQMALVWRWARKSAPDAFFVATRRTRATKAAAAAAGAVSTADRKAGKRQEDDEKEPMSSSGDMLFSPRDRSDGGPTLLMMSRSGWGGGGGKLATRALAAALARRLAALKSLTHALVVCERSATSARFLDQLTPEAALLGFNLLQPVMFSTSGAKLSDRGAKLSGWNRRQRQRLRDSILDRLQRLASRTTAARKHRTALVFVKTTASHTKNKINSNNRRQKITQNTFAADAKTYENSGGASGEGFQYDDDNSWDAALINILLEKWQHMHTLMHIPWFYVDTSVSATAAEMAAPPLVLSDTAQRAAVAINFTVLTTTLASSLGDIYTSSFENSARRRSSSSSAPYRASRLVAQLARSLQLMRKTSPALLARSALQSSPATSAAAAAARYHGVWPYHDARLVGIHRADSLAAAVVTAVQLVPRTDSHRLVLATSATATATITDRGVHSHDSWEGAVWLPMQRFYVNTMGEHSGGTRLLRRVAALYAGNHITADGGMLWHVLHVPDVIEALTMWPLGACGAGRLRVTARDWLTNAPLRYNTRLSRLTNIWQSPGALLVPAESRVTLEIHCDAGGADSDGGANGTSSDTGAQLQQAFMQCPAAEGSRGRTLFCWTEMVWNKRAVNLRSSRLQRSFTHRVFPCQPRTYGEYQTNGTIARDSCFGALFSQLQQRPT